MNDSLRVRIVEPADLRASEAFGRDELIRALQARGAALALDAEGGVEGGWSIVLARQPPSGPMVERRAGRYRITRTDRRLEITGLDRTGLMFGCLDLAEELSAGAALDELSSRAFTPELAVRGIYTFRFHEQAERPWVDDPAFWQRYADELPRWRYNRFTMVFGHQSPYLIPLYAFVLDDLDERFPDITVEGIDSVERERHLRVLQMASEAMASRGIGFMLGIWNSRPWARSGGPWFDHPTRVAGTGDLARLAEHTRAGFPALMRRLPAIEGIQLRMNAESGVNDQRFFVRSYAAAVEELVAEGRRVAVELRNWRLEPPTIEAFADSGADLIVSTKYFAEHMAMPYQPPQMRGGYSYDSLLRSDKRFPLLWQVWSLGSHRLFNWGDPEYARRLARSCHLGDGIGFEVTPPGSQKGFSQWGEVPRDDWRVRTDLPERWDFERYWFFHMAFGRAGYDASVSDRVFLRELARRTSDEAAPAVLAAYQAASRVLSYLISQRMDDQNMYAWPELDSGGPIDHNAIAPPGEESLFSTAREHARRLLERTGSAKLSPRAAAADLERFAEEIDERLRELDALVDTGEALELRTIVVDFRALAALARYHATKARATESLELFYASGERAFLDQAEAAAERAIERWDALCTLTTSYPDVLQLGPSGGHWRDNRPRVEYDLRRIERVRAFFERWGLFAAGFDLGPAHFDRTVARLDPPRLLTGLTGMDPEPRFVRVDVETAHQPTLRYAPATGYGWLDPAGLRARGTSYLLRDLLWGVHHVAMTTHYDPRVLDAVPLDGLTQSYLAGQRTHTFRADVPDGDYEVIAIGPAPASARTPLRAGGRAARLGPDGEARLQAAATGGRLDIAIGDGEPWTLAGLVIRPLAPAIAHLAPPAVRADRDLELSATATAPAGIDGVTLHLRTAAATRSIEMTGDGCAFLVALQLEELQGPALEYSFTAAGSDGRTTTTERFSVPIVDGFEPPRVVDLECPPNWTAGKELLVGATLEHGEHAQELRMHYREVDQNAAFRVARQPGGRSGRYEFRIDTSQLDSAYELMAYVEVVDVLGGGSFAPDPFSDARYRVAKPSP